MVQDGSYFFGKTKNYKIVKQKNPVSKLFVCCETLTRKISTKRIISKIWENLFFIFSTVFAEVTFILDFLKNFSGFTCFPSPEGNCE